MYEVGIAFSSELFRLKPFELLMQQSNCRSMLVDETGMTYIRVSNLSAGKLFQLKDWFDSPNYDYAYMYYCPNGTTQWCSAGNNGILSDYPTCLAEARLLTWPEGDGTVMSKELPVKTLPKTSSCYLEEQSSRLWKMVEKAHTHTTKVSAKLMLQLIQESGDELLYDLGENPKMTVEDMLGKEFLIMTEVKNHLAQVMFLLDGLGTKPEDR